MIRLIVLTSASRFAAPAAMLLAFVQLYFNPLWVGEWRGTAQSVTNSLIFFLPAAIIGSSIDARRLARVDNPWWESTQKALTRTLVLWIALAAPYLIGASCLLLGAYALNWSVSPLVTPQLAPVLLMLGWVLLAVALGIVLGRYFSAVFVAPLAIVLGYLIPVILASTPDTNSALFSVVDDGAVFAPVLLKQSTVYLQAITIFLLAATVVLVAFLRVFAVRGHMLTAVSAVLLLIAAVSLASSNPERRYEAVDASGPRACATTDRGEVCVWVEHSVLLQPAVAAWQKLNQAFPPGSPGVPTGVTESGLAGDDGSVNFSTGSVRSPENEIAATLTSEIGVAYACPDGGFPRARVPQVDREIWLLVRAGYVTEDDAPEEVRSVLNQSERSQKQWWADVRTGAECR